MDEETLRLRGDALDEMHSRSHALALRCKQVPDIYREKIKLLADATDAETVLEVRKWMTVELPPKEYQTEEITWQTFEHFAGALLDALAMYAMRQQLLGAKKSTAAQDIAQELVAIRTATTSPVVAMAELVKVRGKALTTLDNFKVGGDVTG